MAILVGDALMLEIYDVEKARRRSSSIAQAFKEFESHIPKSR